MTHELALDPEFYSKTQQLWTRLRAKRSWRLICLALAMSLIWGVGLACVYSLREASQADASAEYAYKVNFEASRLVLLLHDGETDQRGYLLTGNEEFLKGYNEVSQLAPQSLARLRELTADNPNQQRRI